MFQQMDLGNKKHEHIKLAKTILKMKKYKKSILPPFAMVLVLLSCNDSSEKKIKNEDRKNSEIFQEAVDAYIWAYPLVSIGVSAHIITNTPKPLPNAHAPFNTFGSVNKLFTADDKDVVSSNVDNLYSSAFLDLTQGAIKISVPKTDDRYYK